MGPQDGQAGESGLTSPGAHSGAPRDDTNDCEATETDTKIDRLIGCNDNENDGVQDAVRAALLSNANLAGDNCNRGMLVGALLGAALGEGAIPADLRHGLYRSAALRGMIDALAGMVEAALASETRLHHREGRPQPLPLAACPAAAVSAGGEGTLPVAAAPVDFPGKLRAVQSDAARATAAGGASYGKDDGDSDVGGNRVRYARNIGPVLLPAGKALRAEAALARALGPRFGGAPSTASAGLDVGDAAADRAAALAALGQGGNGSGAPAMLPANEADVEILPCGKVRPRASAAKVPAAIRVALCDPALLDSECAVNVLLGAAGSDPSPAQERLRAEAAPGTGVFYYSHPHDIGKA